jgi:hypothetical protein
MVSSAWSVAVALASVLFILQCEIPIARVSVGYIYSVSHALEANWRQRVLERRKGWGYVSPESPRHGSGVSVFFDHSSRAQRGRQRAGGQTARTSIRPISRRELSVPKARCCEVPQRRAGPLEGCGGAWPRREHACEKSSGEMASEVGPGRWPRRALRAAVESSFVKGFVGVSFGGADTARERHGRGSRAGEGKGRRAA